MIVFLVFASFIFRFSKAEKLSSKLCQMPASDDSETSGQRPSLVEQFEAVIKALNTTAAPSAAESDGSRRRNGKCRVVPLTIKFKEWGWDFVIGPEEMDIHQCSGHCQLSPNVDKKTFHSELLRHHFCHSSGLGDGSTWMNGLDQTSTEGSYLQAACLPSRYESVDLLYIKNGHLHRIKIPNAIVSSCRCACPGSIIRTVLHCPMPSNTTLRQVRVHGREVNDIAIHECAKGHEMSGSSRQTCLLRNGKTFWTPPTPRCTPKTCPKPSPPSHGMIIGSNYSYSMTIVFQCSKGYVLSGSSNVWYCNENGNWENENKTTRNFPQCELDCGDPSNPLNGVAGGNNHKFGGVVTYMCNHGYKRDGAARAQCMADGGQPLHQTAPNCSAPF
eukprot:m.171000 g.171000  ORF g.171000 m.171000 type:complete len:387 (+) comp39047_c0_seq43:506-1666(+)